LPTLLLLLLLLMGCLEPAVTPASLALPFV
jgi:hypothetical protein